MNMATAAQNGRLFFIYISLPLCSLIERTEA